MPDMLDRAARARLRTLSKSNADHVASHLIMAGRLVDIDPERAYEHARTAVRSAGRVDVVREALALTAYATGRYAEALREVRTVRRLSGMDAHPAIEADCERGLGRPERALSVIAEAKRRTLPVAEAVELTLVESGARADLGEHEAALLVVERLLPAVKEPEPKRRLQLVRADRLETLGRHEEAAAVREAAGEVPVEDEDLVVVDLLGEDEEDEDVAPAHAASAVDTDGDVATDEVAEPEAEAEPEADAELVTDADAQSEPEVVEEPETVTLVEPEAEDDEDEPAQVQLDLFADTEEERP